MTSRTGGKRWRWGYLWVLFATPIVVLPFVLMLSLGLGVDLSYWALGDPKSTVIFALAMPMVVAYVMVRIYYWRQDERRARQSASPGADMPQNAGSQ
ncbi:MAG TPA: hypothetical protein VOA78_03015 [Candidatus Dormibacteraeota bacterium]|nr:hypothetical protein [Candidatus Dormibacteraeota bacterium]